MLTNHYRFPKRMHPLLVLSSSVIFIVGYALITLEHRYNLHKAITASAIGASLWILIALTEGAEGTHALERHAAEIFGIVFFLLAAMTLVEVLTHYRFFDWIRSKLFSLGLNDRKQLWVISFVTFFLSAVIDNLTAALVMIMVASRFFSRTNLLVAAAVIVSAANAGGAWSPIGDVTTIMLWLAGKFSTLEIVQWAFLPSFGLFLVVTALLARHLVGESRDVEEEMVRLKTSEKAVIGMALASFPMPLLASRIHLPPYLGLLFGLGCVGILISFFHNRARKSLSLAAENGEPGLPNIEGGEENTHLTSDLEKKLARTDIASLLFFAGILLAVGALEHIGILEAASHFLLGSDPSVARYVVGSGSLGVLSAIVDNIPITAAAMGILATTDPAIWSLLAICVGTGGSMLIIGSAAGVVAMGRVKELTFFQYLRLATLPNAAGFLVALVIWSIQYSLLR